jgi:hypothetical protein
MMGGKMAPRPSLSDRRQRSRIHSTALRTARRRRGVKPQRSTFFMIQSIPRKKLVQEHHAAVGFAGQRGASGGSTNSSRICIDSERRVTGLCASTTDSGTKMVRLHALMA